MVALIRENHQFGDLKYLTLPQYSNLLATYVRSVGKRILVNSALFEVSDLPEIMDTLVFIFNLGPPDRLKAFRPVLDQLKYLERPLWLWLFILIWDINYWDIEELFLHMKEHVRSLQTQDLGITPTLLCFANIMAFLLTTARFKQFPFFKDLHEASMEYIEEAKWKRVWERCGELDWFSHQVELYEERKRGQINLQDAIKIIMS